MKRPLSRISGNWCRRGSELTGYTDSIYRTDRAGDYVRADLASAAGKIRLLVEDRNETIWCSVIENGKIVSEMCDGCPDSAAVEKLFVRKAPSFRSLPPDIIRLAAGHYGITVPPVSRSRRGKPMTRLFFLFLLGVSTAVLFLLMRHLTGLF